MNKKEKIKHILELAAGKWEFFCNLLSVDELNKMLGLLRKYDEDLKPNIISPEDNKVVELIQKNHNEKVKQLTPEEIELIRKDNNRQGDWKVIQAVATIQQRLGLNNKNQTI